MKKWAISITLILIIFAAFFLLFPSKILIENQIIINKPIDEVYSRLSNFESLTEPQWNPWARYDNTAQFRFDGVPGVVGGALTFDGPTVGAGKFVLTELESPTVVAGRIDLKQPVSTSLDSLLELKEVKEGTLVIWSLESAPIYLTFGSTHKAKKLWGSFTAGFLENLKKNMEPPSE